MRRLAFSCLLVVLTSLLALSPRAHAQPHSDLAADDLALQWGVETNLIDEGNRFRSSLSLTNHGEQPLAGEGWTLHFNFLRPIDPASVTGPVEITRINGDFYKLEPGGDFSPLPPGESLDVSFEVPGSAIKRIDAPAGVYVVFTDAQGEPKSPAPVTDVTVEPFTRPEQTTRGPNDVWPIPTPARRYEDNADLTTRCQPIV
jgi:hexosaminidase